MGETMPLHADAEFDRVAQDYRAQHAHSTGVSEDALDYFASYKIEYVQQLWRERGRSPRTIMDFGAGIGNALAPMHEAFPEAEIIALDVSRASLDLVDTQAIPNVRTLAYDGLKVPLPDASLDCIFIACVFHHIPAEHHVALLAELRRVLRPDGVLVLFEHNPLNPLTRLAVARCEFDRDAVLIGAREMRRRLVAGGFVRAASKFCLFFPPALGLLRPLERFLGWLPLGAQYHLVGS
ncbi:class I SAM-dependent methyltransferase [Novosphingobium sp.]|uniref:class I SAM-dependent methyltransferase n=1 Tax=Novosphingobium sp. TaxID=1874826 RepID=UPI002634BB52|nr:class I SAM-dependent methyltransferase [Novosphingobium sp.]